MLLRHLLARGVQRSALRVPIGKRGASIARAARRGPGGDQLERIGEAFAAHVVALAEPVDQAEVEGLAGIDRPAAEHQVECVLHAIRRGARWVPPAPGIRPSETSGRPSFAPATASR